MPSIKTINLAQYLNSRSVISGKENGQKAKDELQIDKLESQYDQIIVEIPRDVLSIRPSFFEAFIFDVFTKLGEKEFRRKFKFVSEDHEFEINEDLDRALDRIQNKEGVLC